MTHFRKSTLKKEAEELRVQLARKCDWNDYDNIIERCEISANKTFVSTKRQQIAKFDRLKGNANTHGNQEEEID